MNKHFQKKMGSTALAAAIALAIAPAAMAGEANMSSTQSQNSDVNVKKDVSTTIDTSYKGKTTVGGHIRVTGLAASVTETNQNASDNSVTNDRSNNNASVKGKVMQNAAGNIGANVAAGDNNAQSNSTALSTINDASFVFGSADAETFAGQNATGNSTSNIGAHNNAMLKGNALQNASGNVGLNIAAGSNNGQQNNAAISVGNNRIAQATTSTIQNTSDNSTTNAPSMTEESHTVGVSLNFGPSENGNGVVGTYKGVSAQNHNFYPDNWSYNSNRPDEGQHPNGPNELGHSDFDQETQGSRVEYWTDNEGNKHQVVGDGYKSAMGFDEAGTLALSGTASGSITYVTNVMNRRTSNDASLDGNALQGAAGNVGLNIAAGSNNLQANSLSVAVSAGAANTGGIGE